MRRDQEEGKFDEHEKLESGVLVRGDEFELCEEEKEILMDLVENRDLGHLHLFLFGLKSPFDTAKFIIKTRLFKTFCIDSVLLIVLVPIFCCSLLFSLPLAFSVNNFHEAISVIRFVFSILFFINFLVFLIIYLTYEILRVETDRRCSEYCDHCMKDREVTVPLVCCPKCGPTCLRFFLCFTFWDCKDAIVLFTAIPILYLLNYILGVAFLGFFCTWFGFRSTFVRRIGACSEREILFFVYSNWSVVLGICVFYFVINLIPFWGWYLIPFYVVVGSRVIRQIEFVRSEREKKYGTYFRKKREETI